MPMGNHRCCTKQKVKRGLWSPEEDNKLIQFVTTHGHKSWSSVSKLAGLQRCGKSCRLRWMNYLRPELKRGSFSSLEEQTIIDVHRMLGNRWSQIAKHLPGRTDNEVKNFWNSCIKKKLISQGLDPNTHNLINIPSSYKKSTFADSSQSHAPISLDEESQTFKVIYNSGQACHQEQYYESTTNYNDHVYNSSSSSNIVLDQPSMCSYNNNNLMLQHVRNNDILFSTSASEPTKTSEEAGQVVQEQDKTNCLGVGYNMMDISNHASLDGIQSSSFDLGFTEPVLTPGLICDDHSMSSLMGDLDQISVWDFY